MHFCPVKLGHWRNLLSSTDQPLSGHTTHLPALTSILHLAFILHIEGMMTFYVYSVFNFICHFLQSTSTIMKLELKKNILNFGYGINFKYEGMLVHSFDRFYVLTKFILPSIGDLNFSTSNYNNTSAYLDNKDGHDTVSKK